MKSAFSGLACVLLMMTPACVPSGSAPRDAAVGTGASGGRSSGTVSDSGAAASGGATGSGGSVGTGGETGSGGQSASGGNGPMGGNSSVGSGGGTGGLAGNGAAAAGGRGGTTGGAGGTAGAVGTGGAGGAPPACTGPAVRVTQVGTRFTLDNGVVQATVNATDATLPSFIINGIEMMQSGGYFTFGTNVYTAGPFRGVLSANPATNGGSVAEVSMTTTWSGGAGVVPFDIEIRYALPRCSQGVYEYVVLTHPATYPAFTPGEVRVNHYIKWDDLFDWYAVDDLRRGPFVSEADAAGAQVIPGAPREVVKYVTGPFADRPGWQKYDNTIEWGEGNVYGWTSTSRRIGLWVINPSNEYLPGGPMKTELTVHDGGAGRAALLNYWAGSHFYGGLEPPEVNQRREKVIGPWLIYANTTTAATGAAAHDQLWAGAKQRLAWEKAAWPYAWESDPRYPPRSGRGTVTGRLAFADPAQPTASVANAWVGLARPPVDGKPNFEHQGWDYQYWVHADGQGAFSLPNVRPGRYTLHAFVAGIHGVHMGQANAVTVAAGGSTDLGTVTWTPERRGPTVWEIGTPDRTPREFFRGDQPWRYGVSLLFASDFPASINYAVGTSTAAKNWNYMQPGGTWNVQFNLASIPAGATGGSLVLDVAGTDGVTLRATMNGTQVGTATLPYDDGSIDRDQPHGVLQSARIAIPLAQLRVGANTLAINSSGRLMWDYLRLEWVMP